MFREDEVRVRRRGETRRVEAETWRRVRRSLKPDGKATVQVAQRAIARRRVRGARRQAQNLRLRPQYFVTTNRLPDCTGKRSALYG